MGVLTWVMIGVVVLAVIGLGAGVFFSGVFRGAQEAGEFVDERLDVEVSSADVLVVTTSEAIYSVGEPVVFTVRNNGDSMMEFSDSALGLEVENTDTGQMYSVPASQVIMELEPGSSKTVTWSAEEAEPGNYVATVRTAPPNEGISAEVEFEIR